MPPPQLQSNVNAFVGISVKSGFFPITRAPGGISMMMNTMTLPKADLRAVLRDHAANVYHAALAVLRDPGAAEGAAQDVFIRLFEHPRLLDGEAGIERLRFRILRNGELLTLEMTP
ncbi:MAG: hypothetical protein HYY18_18675 [Planctomycetes bacterium]|nr:hypothetical protein [Planctomycetota bacterium]